MNSTLRKETPDSDAVASSEDERPWPSATSFGALPRNENGVPGLGGGIWSTQKRGSFKMEKAAQRNAAREAHLGAPNQPRAGLRADSTPSPSASDRSGALPFAIPLQPAPKAGRSLSHSQGQRDVIQAGGLRASSNDPGLGLPLGFLAEEVDTETDSELGGGLTHTTSHPIGSLHRTATYPSSYEAYYGVSNPRDSPAAGVGAHGGSRGDHKYEAAFANLSIDNPQRRAQWQTHLGWDDVPNVNESRRHSLADIPTRRGSLVGPDNRPLTGGAYLGEGYIYDWEDEAHSQGEHAYREAQQPFRFGAATPNSNGNAEVNTFSDMKYNSKDEEGRPLDIPSMYKVPYVQIAEHERTDQDRRGQLTTSNVGQWGANPNRPRKQLYVVSFKCSRVDVFYLLDNTGLFIKEGDIVIVEADRGQDLGTVQHANVTPDDARLYKRKYGEEQYKWLMMFSKNNQQGSVNPNAQLFGENESGGRGGLMANAPASMQGLPRDNFNNLKPKAIKRLANGHEIRMLSEKEGNEAKAKRTCQQKVAHLHLDMEILDAEWQWDFQKLIFYYYADHYINFKDLITELYRIYKTRIWLSAINPASFSQHALGQPPSGIGPGAVGGFNQNLNTSYTMMYGPDPDPYGAVPPYRIGYDTYTPNYPGIPGVANSFAPNAPQGGSLVLYDTGSGDATPSVPPGVTPTGTAADYNYYYERDTGDEQTPKAYAAPNPFTNAAALAATNPYYPSTYGGFAPQHGIGARYGGQGAYGMGGSSDRGQNRGFGGLQSGGGLGTMPTMAGDERSVLGYGYNTPSFGAGNERGPGGLGYGLAPATQQNPRIGAGVQAPSRQPYLPAPIGTRPDSKGSNVPTPTSNPTQAMEQRGFGARMPHEFVPGQYPSQASTGAFLQGTRGGNNETPGDSPHRGNLASLGSGENVDKDQVLRTYLEGLTVKDDQDRHADEMSRER